MGTIKTKTCINCGEFFETVDGRKRSCPACEAKAKEERMNKKAKKAWSNLELMEAEAPETLKMIGGVTVVEPGNIGAGVEAAETPEQKRVRIITSEEAECAWRFAAAIHRNMADYEADNIFGYTFFNAVHVIEDQKACADTILEALE